MTPRCFAVASVALVALVGCKVNMPPTPVPQQARHRLLVQKEFSVASFDFGRRGNTEPPGAPGAPPTSAAAVAAVAGASAGYGLEQALPAMILSELHNEGRFAVYEGGNIRAGGKGEALNESSAFEYVDAYLSGTITSLAKDKVCFDVRMANAISHEVLFTKTACVPLQPDGSGVAPPVASAPNAQPQRDAVKRLTDELSRAIPKIGYARVTSADGRLIFIDKGAKDGVVRGMAAYVVSTGDSVHDPAIHGTVASFAGVDPASVAMSPIVVGELYVLSVEDTYSIGNLWKGEYALPKDTVFFK
jgi:hypothetical protein